MSTTQESPQKVVAYYWGKSAHDGFSITSAPVSLLSTIIYSVVRPNEDGTCELGHPDVDEKNFEDLQAIRRRQPNLQLLLSVGAKAEIFSRIAASPSKTKTFAESCTALALRNGFIGLDIDWEHPVNDGLPARPARERRPQDKANYVTLLRTLRTHLDQQPNGKSLILTVATAAYADHLPDFDLAGMAESLDWFNVMVYDMSDMNPEFTSHSGELFATSTKADPDHREQRPASAKYAIDWYRAHGVPSQKIVFGVPFYGHKWTGVSPENDGLFQSFQTHVTSNDGLAFRKLKPELDKFTLHWDDSAKATWAYDPKSRTMISFDSERALAAKVKYAKSQNLGGMMFWDISEDDTSFDLLHALARAMSAQ